ncbi:hypothetical protein TNCT_463731 [Trichonephila clavata]|uniref:Uncharacterized protein n=1 Tax=Trichonephila clavata TaxID=2740835 RepID=A0A8X6LRA3_TRICU|nr:hypothetical protein TNCT_463731 [Trichonephila clavata]
MKFSPDAKLDGKSLLKGVEDFSKLKSPRRIDVLTQTLLNILPGLYSSIKLFLFGIPPVYLSSFVYFLSALAYLNLLLKVTKMSHNARDKTFPLENHLTSECSNNRMFRRSHVFVCVRKNYCGCSGRPLCRFNAMGSFVRKRPYSDEDNSYENASKGRAA